MQGMFRQQLSGIKDKSIGSTPIGADFLCLHKRLKLYRCSDMMIMGETTEMTTIKEYFFPKIDKEVQSAVDAWSLKNTRNTCWVIFAFEAVALLVFIMTRKEWDTPALVSLQSVLTCLVLCLAGAICATCLIKSEEVSRLAVAVFNSCYYLLFSGWAIQVSVRNYIGNQQIITFFVVQLLMVCFLPLIPAHSIIFSCIIYAIQYVFLYNIDGAKGLNVFNYALMLIATITGMIVRFYSQVGTAEKSVELERSNAQLFFNNRHDGLTGLRNRKALEEDIPKIIDKHVTTYMIDVNYFKSINDTYGHAVGDKVIKATANWVKTVFASDRCYRYGGDEFLILCEHGETFIEDTASFYVKEIPDREIFLSIGHADGTPKDHDELYKIVARADEMLYQVKDRTHKSE